VANKTGVAALDALLSESGSGGGGVKLMIVGVTFMLRLMLIVGVTFMLGLMLIGAALMVILCPAAAGSGCALITGSMAREGLISVISI